MPYTHFTSAERDALQVFRSLDLGMGIIGRILGRHPSSLYREINRNSDHGFYISGKAHARAASQRKQNRPSPVRQNKPLMMCVEKLLRNEYSPDEIVGRIALEQRHPDWHISHETIYRHIYLEARRGKDLRPHLRQGRKHRRKRLLKKDRRGIIPDRVFIDSRPAIVERKARRGDWEGDTVEGAGKQGYVATWVDRSLNENTNGLLRQYLPKSRSFADLTEKELAWIVDKLNNRPRKLLGYRTPREAFFGLPLALQT
ncbi:MAG: IS30 family transposase [Spirochaetes bacterium]|nr:IS30 family transposase [Spirochaetota bacterium]